jgi:hypothetical protein
MVGAIGDGRSSAPRLNGRGRRQECKVRLQMVEPARSDRSPATACQGKYLVGIFAVEGGSEW